MGIQSRWHEENPAVLYTVFSDPWTINDYYAMITEAETLLADHVGVYYQVLDFSDTHQIPPNFLTALRASDSHYNPNLKQAIVIGANRFMQVMGAMAQRLGIQSVSNVHFAESLGEALSLVARDRENEE